MEKIKSLSVEENKKYWDNNPHSYYKGDITGKIIVDMTVKHVGGDVLDIGAANGSLMRTLKAYPKVNSVKGIDLSPKVPEVTYGSATELPFPDQSFDTLFMTDVIEHLNDEDILKAIKEMRRVLRPNGHVVIATINNENLEAAMRHCTHCGANYHPVGHCQVYTPERITKELSGQGFKVEDIILTNLRALAKYKWKAKLMYALGFDKLFPKKPWFHDLIAVAKK